jgi:hypothetical protein
MHSSPSISRLVKSRRMRWVEHLACPCPIVQFNPIQWRTWAICTVPLFTEKWHKINTAIRLSAKLPYLITCQLPSQR